VDKNGTGLKDLMSNVTDDQLKELGLKPDYVSASSAQIDIDKVDQNKLKELFN
jgi:hypothetical protein